MKHLLVPYPSFLRETGGTLKGTPRIADPAFARLGLLPCQGDVAVRLSTDGAFPCGKYTLSVGENSVAICGADETALQYGIVTLAQLTKQYGSSIPCMYIEDAPANRHRAVQISLGQLNVDYKKDWFHAYVKELAMLKATHLYLYFEMDYPFLCLPYYRRKGQAAQEDLRELIKFAASYRITVVPCINVLGHCGDFLSYQIHSGLKEYDPERENPLYSASAALCPNSEEVRRLVRAMIDEICDLFPSEIIHVGGDEVESIGTCPACRPEFEKYGKNGLYLKYFLFINSLLEKRGRKMGIWADEVLIMEPESSFWRYRKEQCDASKREQDFRLLDALRGNTIFYDWYYNGASRVSQEFFAENRLVFIACASTHGCYASAPIPAQGYAQHALYSGAEQLGAAGMLTTDWINQTCSHAELHSFSLASGLALNWCGCGGTFCRNATLQEFRRAYSFQKFGIKDDSLLDYLSYAGDFGSELLSLFPPKLRGAAFRKCVYGTSDPLTFSMAYSPYLAGEQKKKYAECTARLRALYEKIPKDGQNRYFFIYKLPAVLHTLLEKRYAAFDSAFIHYDRAAKAQPHDGKTFREELEKAADLILAHKADHREAMDFAQACSDVLGLERSPVLRLRETLRNIDRLADFIRSMADGRRLLPSVSRIGKFLFRRPQTYYWEPGEGDWVHEDERYISFGEDNDPAYAALQGFAAENDYRDY